jgi:hypothetical protein
LDDLELRLEWRDKVVTVAVNFTETVVRCRRVFPEALWKTVVAKPEAEPHPYWKYPPSNMFL